MVPAADVSPSSQNLHDRAPIPAAQISMKRSTTRRRRRANRDFHSDDKCDHPDASSALQKSGRNQTHSATNPLHAYPSRARKRTSGKDPAKTKADGQPARRRTYSPFIPLSEKPQTSAAQCAAQLPSPVADYPTSRPNPLVAREPCCQGQRKSAWQCQVSASSTNANKLIPDCPECQGKALDLAKRISVLNYRSQHDVTEFNHGAFGLQRDWAGPARAPGGGVLQFTVDG